MPPTPRPASARPPARRRGPESLVAIQEIRRVANGSVYDHVATLVDAAGGSVQVAVTQRELASPDLFPVAVFGRTRREFRCPDLEDCLPARRRIVWHSLVEAARSQGVS